MHTCSSQLVPAYQGTRNRRVILCGDCSAVLPVDDNARIGGLQAVPTHEARPARGVYNAPARPARHSVAGHHDSTGHICDCNEDI